MRGKKELLTLLSIIIGLSITAQNNPGDNVGQLTEVTPEIQPQLDAIPALQLSEISALTQLPESADNSQTIFMRPVFAQVSNECAQAAGVGYMFTYEINRLRNLPANSIMYEENWYPTHYTYNFLNGGFGSTTWHYAGWNIIKENGCPNVLTWGGMVVNYTQWMTGYNN